MCSTCTPSATTRGGRWSASTSARCRCWPIHGHPWLRRQDEWSAAAPASHQLRRDQLLFVGRRAVLPQEVAERSDVLLQPAIRQVAAVTGQDLGLRQAGGETAFVGVAEEELPWLERRARAGCRYFPHFLDHRLRQSIAVAEVVVRMIQRGGRLQVQDREGFDTGELRSVLLVLPNAALADTLRLEPAESQTKLDNVHYAASTGTIPTARVARLHASRTQGTYALIALTALVLTRVLRRKPKA